MVSIQLKFAAALIASAFLVLSCSEPQSETVETELEPMASPRGDSICGDAVTLSVFGGINREVELANQNDELGLHSMAVRYFNGRGVPQNYTRARRLGEAAIDRKRSRSQSKVFLALMLRDGLGGEVDFDRSEKLLLSSDFIMCPQAQTELALLYYRWNIEDSLSKSAKLMKLAAEGGDAKALFYMATMVGLGRGFEKDASQLEPYLRLSAAKNYSPAQYDLSNFLIWKKEVPEALGLMKASADYFPPAKVSYARILRFGLHGVKINLPGSFQLLREAACRGEGSAFFQLATYHNEGVGTAPNRLLALAWLARSVIGKSAGMPFKPPLKTDIDSLVRKDVDAFKVFLDSRESREELIQKDCKG